MKVWGSSFKHYASRWYFIKGLELTFKPHYLLVLCLFFFVIRFLSHITLVLANVFWFPFVPFPLIPFTFLLLHIIITISHCWCFPSLLLPFPLTIIFYIIVSFHANVDCFHVIVASFNVNVISLQMTTIDSLCIIDTTLHITTISFHYYNCYYYSSLLFFFVIFHISSICVCVIMALFTLLLLCLFFMLLKLVLFPFTFCRLGFWVWSFSWWQLTIIFYEVNVFPFFFVFFSGLCLFYFFLCF